MILEDIYNKAFGIENNYKNKKILFIGSESYGATTIGIIEGLSQLGFEILVYKKTNINSWFCNKIIDNLDNIEDNIDFVLSNLHWGTRWSLYKYLEHKVPYILIDEDDRMHDDNISDWKNKYKNYCNIYKFEPSDAIKNMELSPYRWMEDIGNYNPDIVFMGQKYKININSIYLPTSVSDNYIKHFKNKDQYTKIYDITNIPGPGMYREIITNFVDKYLKQRCSVWNSKVYGNDNVPDPIDYFCKNDNNIHSWHRWRCCKDYFEKLMSSNIIIIPPVDKYNAPGGIGIKRVTEGLAAGCYILFHQQPDVDDKQYPISELCPYSRFEFENYQELYNKCEYLLLNPLELQKKKQKMFNNAMKYFTSVPITRYFLWNIKH